MKIVTVLRSGGDFKSHHVQALQRQCGEHAPWCDFLCLTDTGGILGVPTAPLMTNWATWWSKMELFAPEMHDDILYMDLDTVLVGSLDDILMTGKLTILRDFYRADGLQSSLMYLPVEDRAEIWEAFSANPAGIMRFYARGGDQRFLEKFWLNRAARWQHVVPGQVVSYKVHCAVNMLGSGPKFQSIPEGARVVCFHGKPRPWDVPQFQEFYEW